MLDKDLKNKLLSVVIFKAITNKPMISSLIKLLDCIDENSDMAEKIKCYSDFLSSIYEKGTNLSEILLDEVLEDENIYIELSCHGGEIPRAVYECVKHEFEVLKEASMLDFQSIKEAMGYSGYLPEYEVSDIDFKGMYAQRVCSISVYGYGMFVKNRAFMFRDGELCAVLHPDNTRLSQLYGYEYERSLVIDNTKALLSNLPANNVLLYGDCGTGKSSTVKAIVNEFFDEGLRLIEIKKSQLHQLPTVIEQIALNPLKFIVFIDDLSFTSDDDDYSALKAVLEGTVAAVAPNMVIYATSNRRHLIKENFSDRDGDDIHFNDTREEMLSLSERFGLSVTFIKPDKKTYLKIVEELAEQYKISVSKDELHSKAEIFALNKGGRSPRGAKQFIEGLAGKL